MTTLVNNLPSGGVVGGRMRRFRGLVTLASQGTGTVAFTSPTGGIRIPPGHTFAFGVLTGDTSLGSSTLAIGISGATGKYRAAATHTATVSTMFGVTAAVAAASETSGTVGSSPKGTGTDEDIVLTVAAAALPASGTLVVDLYFSAT